MNKPPTRIRPAGLDADAWNRLVLAPLVRLAGAASFDPADQAQILNSARTRQLLEEGGNATAVESILDRLIKHPQLLENAIDLLETTFAHLTPDRKRPLADAIYDAAVAVATASPGPDSSSSIEDTEQVELRRLLDLLGVFNHTLGQPRTEGVTPPNPDPKRPPYEIAAGWTDDCALQAFEILAKMHEFHEAEWQRGDSRLNGIQRLGDLNAQAGERPWVDQGVLVLPPPEQDGATWVIGDLHGDYETLELALTRCGFANGSPVTGDQLIFVGDYGDRGAGTLATWLRIADLKTRFPDRVFLLRGNHEELVPVRLTRSDDQLPLKTEWFIPSTTNREAYLSLSFALQSNISNLSIVYKQLPDIAILPGSTLVVHGCLPPRWKPDDGWSGSDVDKENMEIRGIEDLRKDSVRRALRWTDMLGDRDDVSQAWAGHTNRGRLFAATADIHHWHSILGEFRLIHGHTHPSDGARSECGGLALALNTSRHTGGKQAVARLHKADLETFIL